MSYKTFTKVRTIAYLALTLALAIALGFVLLWCAVALIGFLMAAWEVPTHHWDRSVMKKWGWRQLDWDATISWQKKTTIGGKPFHWDDAFHISKSSIILTIAAITALPPVKWYYSLALGWVLVESFNLFYNYVLDTGE